MNLHMPQDEESEIELRQLATVKNQIISPANNKSIIGIFQDSLLSVYLFTRENIKLTPKEAMNLLMHNNKINLQKIDFTKTEISSFDVLSQVIPNMTLKYKTKRFVDTEDFTTSNNVLEIKNGVFKRGQIEKGILGDTTRGLIQRIYNDYSIDASQEFIDGLQNVVTEYMKMHGYSVGISDLISDNLTNEKIREIITQKKLAVKSLIDELHLGIFENKTGKSNNIEFESRVNNILNTASSEAGKIGRKNLDKENRFIIMVNAGSKGSDLNISQMISCLGQQSVDGKRVPYGFEDRTLPHFSKYDDSPGARGFIESSFIKGLEPEELFFHAMGGRVGLIDTAVKSVTRDTPIIVIEDGKCKYYDIGDWIDNKIDNPKNKEFVELFGPEDANMEMLGVENEIYMPSCDKLGNIIWGKITNVSRHDPGEILYYIKTLSGRDITVTKSKSIMIWNGKELEHIATPDLKKGDLLATTMNLPEPPIIKEYIDMTEYFPKTEYIYGTDFHIAKELIEETLTKRKILPNGWWEKHNGKSFTLPYPNVKALRRTLNERPEEILKIKKGCLYKYKTRITSDFPDKFELNKYCV